MNTHYAGKVSSGAWICSQLGAREHYSVPRALKAAGRLSKVFTDFWAGSAIRRLAESRDSQLIRLLSTRFHPELEESLITSWNLRAIMWECQLRERTRRAKQKSSGEDCFFGFIEVGRSFSKKVRSALRRQTGLNGKSIFFGYDTASLEAMEWCRGRGIKCVLGQMDPNRGEFELVRNEENCWPGWALKATVVPEEYLERRAQEWALADRIVVNSDFCRESLVKQGVSSEKISVVPLCYELNEGRLPGIPGPSTVHAGGRSTSSRLRVLWLGQVILRKGIQYLIEAARQLEGEPIQFDIVGPIGISKNALASAPSNLTFHGRVTRDQAAEWYSRSDVFVLPTISDGFAITQLEAMAHGLPVIATSCCGQVVSNGVDGFLVPARDPANLARTLSRYISEPLLLDEQRKAAAVKVGQFTLGRLAGDLIRLENSLA